MSNEGDVPGKYLLCESLFVFFMAMKFASVLRAHALSSVFLSIQEVTLLAVRQTTRRTGKNNQAPPATRLLVVRPPPPPLLNSNRIEEHEAVEVPQFQVDFCEFELGFCCLFCLNACKDYFIGRPGSHHKEEQGSVQKPIPKQSTPSFFAKWYPEQEPLNSD
jgi:hypothetical protein